LKIGSSLLDGRLQREYDLSLLHNLEWLLPLLLLTWKFMGGWLGSFPISLGVFDKQEAVESELGDLAHLARDPSNIPS